jgi:hypothetical protein
LLQRERDQLLLQLNEKSKTIIGYRKLVINPSETIEEVDAKELDMRRIIDCDLDNSSSDEESPGARRKRPRFDDTANEIHSEGSFQNDGNETETSQSKRA